MAKKDKKAKDKQSSGAAEAVEAVRAAVERTFQATTEGAAGTQKRTRDLVDEVAHAAARVRETIEDIRLLDDLKGLRDDVQALARRVAALEVTHGKPSARRTPAAKPSAAKPAAAKRASSTRRASAAKASGTTRAKSSTTTRAKSSGTTRAKPSARKPAGGSSSSSGSSS